MTKRPRARLRRLKLTELSLVDSPANPEARVTLHKRDDSKDENHRMRFEKITPRDNPPPASFNSLEDAMAEIRKRESCSRLDAMKAAARQHPELVEKYNQAGDDAVAKAREDAEKARQRPPAVIRFDMIVEGIMERDKITRAGAMQRARREHPAAYAAYQTA